MGNYSSTYVSMSTCQHCGNVHTGQCPRVKSIEYHKNGKVKRVEYFDMQPAVSVPFVQTEPSHLRPPYKITCGSTGSASSTITIDNPVWKTGTIVDKPTAEWLTFTYGTLVRDWASAEDVAAWDGVNG